MGTERLNNLVLAAVTVLVAGCTYSSRAIHEQTLEARNNLKDYALVSCLIAVDPDSKLAEDLKATKRSLSFMGNGNYKVIQDEETFEMVNDPYNDTVRFLMSEATRSIGYMKDGSSSRTYGCFKAAQSEVFEKFIARQDEFIDG